MNQRLQQIMCNNFPFGGIIFVLIGDTGLLPAVRDRVMWEVNPKSPNNIAELGLYKQFLTVLTLTENV